jgi:hypothetical protein
VTLYIIIGRTHRFRDSRVVIGKFKDLSRELQDVFVAEKIRRGVRRESEVYVFRAVERDPLSWFFVSFDIKAPKKPGYEYTVIMREMFFNLCARVDRSTYICPERVDAKSILAKVGVETNVETHYVVPNDERATAHLREAIVSGVSISENEPPKGPLSYIKSTLIDMIVSVKKADRRANRVREYAEQLLARARSVLELVRKCRAKFTAIGIDPSQIELDVERLIENLEAALREKWEESRS